jgi:hypothetical protein
MEDYITNFMFKMVDKDWHMPCPEAPYISIFGNKF